MVDLSGVFLRISRENTWNLYILGGTNAGGGDGLADWRVFDYNGNADAEAGNTLEAAARNAKHISSYFSENNSDLCEGWYSVSSFTEQINIITKKLLNNVSSQINTFATNTLTDEGKAAQAAEEAGTKAEEILSSLGYMQKQ